jgi:hypothetical protein
MLDATRRTDVLDQILLEHDQICTKPGLNNSDFFPKLSMADARSVALRSVSSWLKPALWTSRSRIF